MAFPPYHEFNVSYGSSTEKRQANATWVMQQLTTTRGYSYNAAVGIIANFDQECRMNPNDPQYSGFPNANSKGKYQAFGWPQWDIPSGNGWKGRIGRYAEERGLTPTRTDDNPLADGDLQLDYLEADAGESIYGKYWYQYQYSSGKQWYLPWEEFKISTRSVEDLAKIFYWSYERSSGGTTSANERAKRATYWDDYFGGEPTPPEPGSFPVWLLFKFKGRGIRL